METELQTWLELLQSNSAVGIIKCAKRRDCTKPLLSAHCVMTSHDNYLIHYVPFGLNLEGHMPLGQIGTNLE